MWTMISTWSSNNPWSLLGGVMAAIAVVVLLGFVLLLAALKLYAVMSCGVCRSRVDMHGKVVMITGATSGIGRETARDLARRGARMVLACRDLEKANKTKDELVADTGNSDIVVVQLDLRSQRSIRACAAEVLRTERALHVLIHNAGTAETRTRVTEDGLEATMATNHFGPFLLTHLLIELLKKTSGARIVVVASVMYRVTSMNLERLNPLDSYVPAWLYFVSKYTNIVFTMELARRLEGTGVTANCLHPGMIRTEIYRHVWFPLRWPMLLIIHGFFKTPEQGAQTSIHCAVSERLAGVSGKYFMDCQEASLTRAARCPAKAKKLWELSEKFANLQDSDPKI